MQRAGKWKTRSIATVILAPRERKNMETNISGREQTGAMLFDDQQEEEVLPLRSSFSDMLFSFLMHWRRIAVMAVLGAVVGIGVAYVLPPQYTATITIMTPQQNASLSSALLSQLGSSSSMASLASSSLGMRSSSSDMYIAMLKSRSVEDAMVEKFGLMQLYHARLASDARLHLAQKTSIAAVNKSGLINLSFTDANPQRAAAIANGYIDQFRLLTDRLAVTEAGQRRMYYEQQLQKAKNDLTDAEVAMENSQNATGVLQLDSQARALIQNASGLRAQITLKEAQIQGMRTYAAGENAQLAQAKQELESMRAQLASLDNSSSQGGSIVMPKGKLTSAGLEYERNLRELKYRTAIYEILAKQYEAARLDEAREGVLIQVVDPAVAPDRRSFPRRSLCMVGGLLLGIMLCLIWISAREKFHALMADPAFVSRLASLRSGIVADRHGEAIASSLAPPTK